MNNNSTPRSDLSLLLWLAYVLFVVYGSLVPLQYKALPLNEAWAAFQNIPFLQLGVESRADWVANGVLYVPVAFLTTHLLVQSVRKIPRIFLFVLAAAFSIALAVAVEFTQLYFPHAPCPLTTFWPSASEVWWGWHSPSDMQAGSRRCLNRFSMIRGA